MKQNLRRVRMFCKLIHIHSPENKRLTVRQAWHVAGVSTGKVIAMPDDMIEWWWKIQDVVESDMKQKGAAIGK